MNKNKDEYYDSDFRLQLQNEEANEFSRSKKSSLNAERWHNIKYLPYDFTEQGIYMFKVEIRS